MIYYATMNQLGNQLDLCTDICYHRPTKGVIWTENWYFRFCYVEIKKMGINAKAKPSKMAIKVSSYAVYFVSIHISNISKQIDRISNQFLFRSFLYCCLLQLIPELSTTIFVNI